MDHGAHVASSPGPLSQLLMLHAAWRLVHTRCIVISVHLVATNVYLTWYAMYIVQHFMELLLVSCYTCGRESGKVLYMHWVIPAPCVRRVQSDCSFLALPWYARMQKLHISVKHCKPIEGIGKHTPHNINHNVTSHTTGNYCIPAQQFDVWHFTRLSPTGVKDWLRKTKLLL